MSRLGLAAALLLAASTGAAQNMEMHVGPDGMTIRMDAPTAAPPAPAPLPVAAAAPEPAQGPAVLSDADLQSLLAAIEAEGFSEGKLAVVETAARDAWFAVAQVGAIVDALQFPQDKVKSVALLRRRIVDHQNDYQLYAHFTFDSDKAQVKKLLR